MSSRTTYGCIAFKLPFYDDLGEEKSLEIHKHVVQQLAAIIKQHEGELTTLADVMAHGTPLEDRLGESSVEEIVNGK